MEKCYNIYKAYKDLLIRTGRYTNLEEEKKCNITFKNARCCKKTCLKNK